MEYFCDKIMDVNSLVNACVGIILPWGVEAGFSPSRELESPVIGLEFAPSDWPQTLIVRQQHPSMRERPDVDRLLKT